MENVDDIHVEPFPPINPPTNLTLQHPETTPRKAGKRFEKLEIKESCGFPKAHQKAEYGHISTNLEKPQVSTRKRYKMMTTKELKEEKLYQKPKSVKTPTLPTASMKCNFASRSPLNAREATLSLILSI